ncbi:hypothetical protein Ciccas_009303 [Cichlidogyrus casuarinus]|uniref:Uncharacterized protein n=1 Tax=Cichlidogyrus casuarinus TaxID=1844966 RepID=A0ABD2PXF7_9PLAT
MHVAGSWSVWNQSSNWLWQELDEVDYASLSELEKRRIDQVRLQKRREKRRLELEKRREDEEERARLESEQRRTDNERQLPLSGKKAKQGKGDVTARGANSALSNKLSKHTTAINADGNDSRSTDRTDALHDE